VVPSRPSWNPKADIPVSDATVVAWGKGHGNSLRNLLLLFLLLTALVEVGFLLCPVLDDDDDDY
jgi:hypothetical protein